MRKIRILLATLVGVVLTGLFLDFTGTIHGWMGWLAKIQFLPALFALNMGVVIGLLLLTLLFGRIYCSVICPLGIFQDVVSSVNRKKNRFRHSPAMTWLRYGVLGLFVIAFIAGIGSVVALLEPYSTYGRMVSNLLAPLYQWGNNYIDYMLLHGVDMGNGMEEYEARYVNNGVLDFLLEERREGRIRNLGFSYHCDIKVFDYLLSRRAFLVGYDRSVPRLRQASHCTGCNQCSIHCPQMINIPQELIRIDSYVEDLKQGTL